MKTCDHYQELLMDFLKKKLPQEEEKDLAGHLTECSACQAELKQVESLLKVMEEEEVLQLSPEFWSSFPAQLRERIESQKKKQARFKPAWVLAPTAAVMALFLAVNLFKVDQSYLTKKESLPEGSLAWLELPADSGQVAQELNLALAELSQEVEESYWEKEDLSTLLADLSEREFQSLAQEIKAEKF
jgi:hypothetical protein